ncbi:GNAT family N-acetyltransferase [Kitasatospora viridis]|uniref:RimJ/RimL family protein N-acetyltransferase n=1 Tax=Kitasatospora viridis TaxID=281105 RepID=A0A561UD58_9ACTN|nr:GNAT family N-acetyltransferase [Kitasatospora viridis]TWF97289.1 RimJ/RimL family protein N-acetyltransferase [Kitasatospora viridis]
MTSPAPTLDLLLLDTELAARVAAGAPAPEDRWAEGFPREDDSDPASIIAKSAVSPGEFGVYALVPRSHGKVIGTAGFFGPPDAEGAVTIGYGMVEPEWGQGYGTEAVAGLIAVCRAHGGVTSINADTDLDNVGSQRVLQKNGFTRTHVTDAQEFYTLRLGS